MRTGLLLVRRESTCITCSISGPPDHGVELVVFGQLGQVAAELVKCDAGWGHLLASRSATCGPFFSLVGAVDTGQQLDDLLTHPWEVGAQADQDLRPDALAFAGQAEEDVLGTYVVVAQDNSFTQRLLEYVLGQGGKGGRPAGGQAGGAAHLLDLFACGLEADPK